ncbi:thermonuclease family protein [Chroococcidiopsis sp. TS-821]|uniref:thermonuclease family protein n=1 Tax=Chroococcidiopsis sp. TS-821 TaxID=1378066 RepID=UPI000D4E7959|nr:thermonuclease family protein [Chroococcidiopsis sp. TS-821]PPS44829.1 nuclease [Chroococcidiopsis sp. TS-821]
MKLPVRSLLLICAIILLLGLSAWQFLIPHAKYTVLKVSDGDTITVTNNQGAKIHVRFACIDAPEIPHSNQEKYTKSRIARNQFHWGMKAQQRVQQLIDRGGDRVSLKITDSDRYGRQIAEVRLADGTLIQEVLAREGLALVYRPYLKNCPSATAVERAEASAKSQRIGVWSDSHFVEPWQYRSRK